MTKRTTPEKNTYYIKRAGVGLYDLMLRGRRGWPVCIGQVCQGCSDWWTMKFASSDAGEEHETKREAIAGAERQIDAMIAATTPATGEPLDPVPLTAEECEELHTGLARLSVDAEAAGYGAIYAIRSLVYEESLLALLTRISERKKAVAADAQAAREGGGGKK